LYFLLLYLKKINKNENTKICNSKNEIIKLNKYIIKIYFVKNYNYFSQTLLN